MCPNFEEIIQSFKLKKNLINIIGKLLLYFGFVLKIVNFNKQI